MGLRFRAVRKSAGLPRRSPLPSKGRIGEARGRVTFDVTVPRQGVALVVIEGK